MIEPIYVRPFKCAFMSLLNHESIITHMSQVGECKKLCKLIYVK